MAGHSAHPGQLQRVQLARHCDRNKARIALPTNPAVAGASAPAAIRRGAFVTLGAANACGIRHEPHSTFRELQCLSGGRPIANDKRRWGHSPSTLSYQCRFS
jgi:hypothetical protein